MNDLRQRLQKLRTAIGDVVGSIEENPGQFFQDHARAQEAGVEAANSGAGRLQEAIRTWERLLEEEGH